MRRSGNHACINWLANSIYGEKVGYKQLQHYLFRQFPGNKIFFINSYAQESALSVFRFVLKYRKQIRNCEYLFLSLEDEPPQFRHFLQRTNNQTIAIKIHINRSVFNMLSSRSKKIAVDEAKEGRGIASNFEVSGDLIKGLFDYRRSDFIQWEYDQWLISPEWRKDFLNAIGLCIDIIPDMSIEAGGSSFTAGSKEKLNVSGRSRYKIQAIPEAWLKIVEDNYKNELTPEEQQHLLEIRS